MSSAALYERSANARLERQFHRVPGKIKHSVEATALQQHLRVAQNTRVQSIIGTLAWVCDTEVMKNR
jgi:hypothetical protein